MTINPPTAVDVGDSSVRYTPLFSIRADEGADRRRRRRRLLQGQPRSRRRNNRNRNEPLSFWVDPKTGAVKISQPLDYETAPWHAFIIDIRAGGLPGDTAFL